MSLASSQVGGALGRYHIVATVGHGGMSDVYLTLGRGEHGADKLVVVKVLRASMVDDPETIAMFQDEARLAVRLQHPNIVQTFEFGSEGGLAFMAMEYLDGQPLHRIPRRFRSQGGFPLEAYLHVFIEVLSALEYAHELKDYDGTPLGIVHRDVSPQNIFVGYGGDVKLMDFGIAKSLHSGTHTAVGSFKGKLVYMAPEQARAEAVDDRADIFALGLIMWEALAGRRLWAGRSDAEVAAALAEGSLPETGLPPRYPKELTRIIQRAIAITPESRWSSAGEMREALESFVRERKLEMNRRQLAKLVSDAFAEDRKVDDETIQSRLRELSATHRQAAPPTPAAANDGTAAIVATLRREAAEGLAPELSGAPPDTPTRREHPSIPSAAGSPPLASASGVLASPSPRPPRRSGALLGTVAAVAAIGGLWGAAREGWIPGLESVGVGAGDSESLAFDRAPDGDGDADAVADTRSMGGPPRAEDGALAAAVDGCAGPDAPLVRLSGEIEQDATLRCDRRYLLTHTTFVRPGTTLSIEAGTVIHGDKETLGTLVIQPGARLVADGRADAPIRFTSDQPEGQRQAGDWGGVIVLGNAPINARDKAGEPVEGQVEGLARDNRFGGNDPEDDSGILRYVSIEYAGTELAPNNEINGLTLAGVGRSTTLDHVRVYKSADDCFEFFGGTVDARHLICDSPGDDGFDFDLGYRGHLQYLSFQAPDDPTWKGHAFEIDNEPGGEPHSPRTRPHVSNVSACGPDIRGGENHLVLARRAGRAILQRVAWAGFPQLVEVRDPGSDLDWKREDPNPGLACRREIDAPDLPNHPYEGFFEPAPYLGAFSGPADRWDAWADLR